ncbi:hypothetical protein ACHHYP_12491 [Achlya hypogyna]|uniref:VWFA domain-containing protein n=1 Tax=Achlya hypogyna TaxID=1202772 RepID=A0A1V9YH17_ACHHY|nr:hypothetical protein ACHHYP_12491 [Achlya hypogyna]
MATMEDDAKDALASPPVREVHLQAEDFSHFDGASLSAWHLSQLLQPTPKGPPVRSDLDILASAAVQATLADEGVRLAGVKYAEADPAIEPSEETHDAKTDDRPVRLSLSPQTAVYLSFRKYRLVICLDASPSSLSIDPISGTLFLDVSFQSVERLLLALVQRPLMGDLPELHVSILVQGALVDSLCVLAQGYTVDASNVHMLLQLLRQRLQLLEDNWATAGVGTSTAPPSSLAMTLQNATFALNSLPHDAAPLLVLVTDGVVDLPHVYAYDHMMMQLARHHITCHAIQLGGGFVPHCSFGYVPDTDLLRYVTAATGGAFFDMHTLSALHAAPGPFANHVQAACFLQPSKVCPANPSPELPLVADRVSMDAVMAYRPLRLFREKVHEFKFVGAAAQLARARLEEGFCVARVVVSKDSARLHCVLQWTSDVWLEYTIGGPLRIDGELAIRIDVLAHAKFLEEFAAVRATPAPPLGSLCVLLHRFLKDMYERDRTFLHLVSAMQVPTLDQDTKLHAFSRMTTTVTAPHPVFSLVGELSPLLWHRWFHVERFEMLAVEQQYPKDALLLETLGRWATMALSTDIYLKFLDTATTSSGKGNVNRKQRGSLTLALPSAATTPARKALCFLRLECSGHALVVVHVAFYGTTTAARKAVLQDLQRTLFQGVNPVEPPSMVVCHRHVQRLFLLPHVIHDLIAPPVATEERSANSPLMASCCSGSGLVSGVFAAYMWRTLWCWHVELGQQAETIERLQEERLAVDGFCIVHADDRFVLLAKEIWLDGRKSAVVQYAITVVSDACLCTSLWMEPTSGRVVEAAQASEAFGTPPLDPVADDDGVESAEWYQEVQQATYLADVHILSCMSTFYRILDATKDDSAVVGPLDRAGPAARAGPFPVHESPFSTARLLTTAVHTSDRFLLYMEPEAANRELHALLVESVQRLSDCEVVWTDEMGTAAPAAGGFPRLTGGPLWSAAREVHPQCSPLAPGRCFAKMLSDTTFVLAFVPALESVPEPTTPESPAPDTPPSDRLKWLAGLSSSVVLNVHHPSPMTGADVARFEARRALFTPKAAAAPSYRTLPIAFHECSLENASLAASSVLDGYVRSLKAAHETNFAHGVYRALRDQRVALQPCDLLQALWSCQQVAIDLDVSLLHHMLHLLPTAPVAIDGALDALLSRLLTSIPRTQWYYFANGTDDDVAPFFVRLECWQDDGAPDDDADGSRPRSKSVRVLSDMRRFTDVLKSMLCASHCDTDSDSSADAEPDDEAKVLAAVEALRAAGHTKTYLRLVVMTLPPEPHAKKDEATLPAVQPADFHELRTRLQELCAVQVLSMLQCLPSLTPSLGALVQALFAELPETSLRKVQYPLEFLPVEGPVSALALFKTQLVASGALPLRECNDAFFVTDASYWAFFTVADASVWLSLHVPPGAGLDEVGLLTRLHLGVLAVAKQVNQFILLQQLHESRTCSALLVAPPRASPPAQSGSFDGAFFWPGQFECPCQFKKTFKLQERLSPQRTLSNLCTAALEQFQVHNRLHMFVYKDKRSHVFYMRLALVESSLIELQVFGICSPAEEVTVELCRVLERKLDEATQLILMKLLARNAKFQLSPADITFLRPDTATASHVAEYPLPPEVTDAATLLLLVKEKLTEPSYARAIPSPVPPMDATTEHPAFSAGVAGDHDARAVSPVFFTAEPLADVRYPLSFVLNITPPDFGRSSFVSSCGKGLALVYMDLMQGETPARYLPTGRWAPRGTAWSKVLAPTPTFAFPDSRLAVRFRVYVRGHLNVAHLSEVFSLSVKQALYEYAMEAILAAPAPSSTATQYPSALLAEVKALLHEASALTATTAVVLQQQQVLPSFELPHVVGQLQALFKCLPAAHSPSLFYRPAPGESFAAHDLEVSKTASYSFTDTFALVCPFTTPSMYTFEDPAPAPPTLLVKVSSSSSLMSVDTNSSLVSPSPRAPGAKDVVHTDVMLHPQLQASTRRHLFFTLEVSHGGVVFLGYNLHPQVVESLSGGVAKALAWCQLRQALLASILFQKRGFALAAPTQCAMLQPSALLDRRPPLVGKTPLHLARDIVHASVPFTPQIFHLVLEHPTAPRALALGQFRAVEGMGLAEYLRETGTAIEDLAVRPRAISGNTEKLELAVAASTPMSTASSVASSVASAPRSVPAPAPSPIVRKAVPNATNALMAARARARGPLKGPAAPPTPTATTDDAAENKAPPAWTLTLNKDAIPPRVSKSKAPGVVPSAVALAQRRPSGPLPQHPEAKPAAAAHGTMTRADSTGAGLRGAVGPTKETTLVWRQALKTLLPSSFSHYHRDDRENEGSTKAKDPLVFHGVNLRSALDFHESYRSRYTMVYDLFRSLMAGRGPTPSPFTLAKLLGCGRLILHRHLAVTFAGGAHRRHVPTASDDILSLLAYEIAFIFNDLFSHVARLHVDDILFALGGPSSSSYSAYQAFAATASTSLAAAHAADVAGLLEAHLAGAGFAALQTRTDGVDGVYCKKADGVAGLILVELRQTKAHLLGLRALFVSERDVVSLDAGRHLPQSSHPLLSRQDLVRTFDSIARLLSVRRLVYDYVIRDLHAFVLHTLTLPSAQLRAHVQFADVGASQVRDCVGGMLAFLDAYPVAPEGAAGGLQAWDFIVEDVDTLIRYIACHATRYYVSDLLVFGTADAIATRSASGRFIHDFNVPVGDSAPPYALVLTSTSRTTLKVFALHMAAPLPHLWEHVELFVMELMRVASVDYQRDVLWSRLLFGAADTDLQPREVDVQQLEACLALSVRTPFERIDPALAELLAVANVDWGDFLAMLKVVHKDGMREYQFHDRRHVLLMCESARDIMIHIYYDDAATLSMEICRREEPATGALSHEQRKTLRDLVNHIVYWLWTQVAAG